MNDVIKCCHCEKIFIAVNNICPFCKKDLLDKNNIKENMNDIPEFFKDIFRGFSK